MAYANSLGMVVDYCIAKKIELPRPRGIITSAEVLTDENRAKIESYFRCQSFRSLRLKGNLGNCFRM